MAQPTEAPQPGIPESYADFKRAKLLEQTENVVQQEDATINTSGKQVADAKLAWAFNGLRF